MKLPKILIREMQRLERGLDWVIQNSASQDIYISEKLDKLEAKLCRYGVTEGTIYLFRVAVLAEYGVRPGLFQTQTSSSKEYPELSFFTHLKPTLVAIASELIHYGELSKIQAEYQLRKTLNEFGRPLHFISGQRHENFFSGIINEAYASPPLQREVIRMQEEMEKL